MIELIPHLPGAEQKQVLNEADCIVGSIDRNFDVDLIQEEFMAEFIVPSLAKLGYYRDAFDTAQELYFESERADALIAIVSCLPKSYHIKMLDIVWTFEDTKLRSRVLKEFARYLSGSLLGNALVAAREIGDRSLSEVLIGFVPRLSESLLSNALAAVQEIGNSEYQADALVELIGRLAELGHYEEALTTAQKIELDWRRAEVLARLAAHLSEPEREPVLQKALDIAQKLGWTSEGLAKDLVTLTSRLSDPPSATLHLFWHSLLPILARRTRQDMLANIGVLAPTIVTLGGEEAIAETFRAIQDVGRWWP